MVHFDKKPDVMTACLATEAEQMIGLCRGTTCLQEGSWRHACQKQVKRRRHCDSRAATHRLLSSTSWPVPQTHCLLSLLLRLVLSLRKQGCHPSISVLGVAAAAPDQLSAVAVLGGAAAAPEQLSAVTAVAARAATFTLGTSTLLF